MPNGRGTRRESAPKWVTMGSAGNPKGDKCSNQGESLWKRGETLPPWHGGNTGGFFRTPVVPYPTNKRERTRTMISNLLTLGFAGWVLWMCIRSMQRKRRKEQSTMERLRILDELRKIDDDAE